jgi:hypothetical protein
MTAVIEEYWTIVISALSTRWTRTWALLPAFGCVRTPDHLVRAGLIGEAVADVEVHRERAAFYWVVLGPRSSHLGYGPRCPSPLSARQTKGVSVQWCLAPHARSGQTGGRGNAP